jgi:UDP-N-acetylglucosamine--N-acetylmuramyl-(pentapeptide) pyrophosphoryl-undecaprenol N-acetylglucosamine transferase
MDNNIKKIILTGGGTGGSVVPLLSLAKDLSAAGKFSYEFLWLGTNQGPEKQMVAAEKMNYQTISCGKLRRYWSWQNLVDIIKIKIGFWQSLFIVLKWKPDLIISAGSFVSVPVIWAGWFLGVPAIIHQQDVVPGLANKLMAPVSKKITVTFAKSLADYGNKAVLVGNPLRSEFENYTVSKSEAREKYGLRNDLPVVLVLGGGTGAWELNNLTAQIAPEMIKVCQMILITGQNKNNLAFPENNFKFFEFLNTEGMIKVYSAADIVVSRCGMGVLTELSYFGKPAILIPMPNSHQEKNAAVFAENEAAIVLHQNQLDKDKFTASLKSLISDEEQQIKLAANIKKLIKIDKTGEMLKVIYGLLGSV